MPEHDSSTGLAIWLMGWLLTLWSLAMCASAVVGDTLVQRQLAAAHCPAPHVVVVAPLALLACAMIVGHIIKSWLIIALTDVFGAILCITNAIFVFPQLFNEGAGPEVVNWVYLSIQFLILGVLMTLHPEALRNTPDLAECDLVPDLFNGDDAS